MMRIMHHCSLLMLVSYCVRGQHQDEWEHQSVVGPSLGMRTTPVVLIEVVDGTTGVSSNVAHDDELCIDPSPVDGDVCVMHKENALDVCVNLPGCIAVSCLPEGNYAAMPTLPTRHRTANGAFIGEKVETAQLRSAAKTGNLAELRSALAAGADVDGRDSKFGRTALMIAARSGDLLLVNALLDAGSDPRAMDWQGTSVSEFAVFNPNVLQGNGKPPLKESKLEWAPELAGYPSDTLAAITKALAAWELVDYQLQNGNVQNEAHAAALVKAKLLHANKPSWAASLPEIQASADSLGVGIHGPICFAKSSKTQDMPHYEECAYHNRNGGPGCENLEMTPHIIDEVVDISSVPGSLARKLNDARKERRSVFVLPRLTDTTLWARLLLDYEVGQVASPTGEALSILIYDTDHAYTLE